MLKTAPRDRIKCNYLNTRPPVKTRNPEDGRGIDVRITNAGLDRLRDAYPIHLASVRNRIMNQVDPKNLSCFGNVLASIVAGIEKEPEGQ